MSSARARACRCADREGLSPDGEPVSGAAQDATELDTRLTYPKAIRAQVCALRRDMLSCKWECSVKGPCR